ncbi:MAG TPA: hypothetical protein VHI13_10795 [Candidatus Kapabacteria bacterium]|nr:hypothetical protein [Candidatus Kapabacteria bacterium]
MNGSIAPLLALTLLATAIASCSKTDAGAGPPPVSVLPQDCGFYPKGGSTFTYRYQPVNGAPYVGTDSIVGRKQFPDTAGYQLEDVRPTWIDYGVSVSDSGDVWIREANESGAYIWMARLGVCSMQSWPGAAIGESGFHHSFGGGPGSWWTITRSAGTIYLGEEPLTVGADTLICQHVRAWQDYSNHYSEAGLDTIYTGTVTHDYWFSRSLGYFVKIVTPTSNQTMTTMTLIAYKLVR